VCGIAGFWLTRALASPEIVLRRMTDSLLHRGPDAGDQWFESNAGIGLGHRRLAIVDLTDTGRQPMRSISGRYVAVFNGEIYNFQAIRSELQALGSTFRGQSDTEVMLAAFDTWGVSRAVRRLAGMFAIALWDANDGTLYLIRDRLGKKPLYYGTIGGNLVFGSELKALRSFPGFDADIDRNALALYLRHNYVPSPWSIHVGIRKLPAGSILKVSAGRSGLKSGPPEVYWSVERVFDIASSKPAQKSADSIQELDDLLRDSVSLRMIADVPVGGFLSGGIDSSLVVALMQAQSSRRVQTFTIGFHEELYDEAPHARAIAKHLGTDHTEVYVTPAEARGVIPHLPVMYDEPFSDSSQIPTFLVSQVARRKVTVALSGDGGDELFCGYTRYLKWRTVWRTLQRFPRPLQLMLARTLRSIPASRWNALLSPIVRALPSRARYRSAGEKLHKLSDVLDANDPGILYLGLVSHWTRPSRVVLGAEEPSTILNAGGGPHDLDEFTTRMMELDLLTYLPDDILVKVDRASMAVSLESRAPFLDHRVVEFAASLPLSQKLRGSTTKWIVRRVLEKYVPRELFERPKMGFGVPIDSWLRGPLRDWAEDLLSESRLRSEGFFDSNPIRQLWLDHQARRTEAQYPLWDILMFQAWLRELDVGKSSAAA
jgi:asparagine synthase (glutamine-hydrolysing)